MRPETRAEIEALFPKYPEKRGALLPAIYLVQAERGFVEATARGRENDGGEERVGRGEMERHGRAGPPGQEQRAGRRRALALQLFVKGYKSEERLFGPEI